MQRVEIKKLYRQTKDYAGKEITVAGWIRNIRDSKVFGFIELNDGSFFKNTQIFYNRHRYTLILRLFKI